MNKLRVLTTLIVLLLMCSPSWAALTDWGVGAVEHVADPDEGFMAGREILNAWHKYDVESQMHFFKMELKAAPMGPVHLEPSFAGIYGFALNTDLGTGIDGFTPGLTYAPNVPSIDYLIDAHYEYAGILAAPPAFQVAHYHEWDEPLFVTENLLSIGGDYARTGKVLEWAVPDSLIGNPGSERFSWCAYTLDGGSETAKYDVACSVIPEPLTMAGLGLGLAGVAGYLRRRKAA